MFFLRALLLAAGAVGFSTWPSVSAAWHLPRPWSICPPSTSPQLSWKSPERYMLCCTGTESPRLIKAFHCCHHEKHVCLPIPGLRFCRLLMPRIKTGPKPSRSSCILCKSIRPVQAICRHRVMKDTYWLHDLCGFDFSTRPTPGCRPVYRR